MSSTQITNLDLSEPQEILDTEVKSKESNDTSTLNSEDQEVQNNLSEEKQKDKDLESEAIVKEREQFEEVVEEQQKDTDNDSARRELNQEEQDKENSGVTDLKTNETEQISEENKDQSEWSAVWDDNVQAYYYWNMVTNETTWVNPNNNNLTVQTVNPEYSEQDYYYYYSQYGYYPEAYYYGYDNSTLTASSDMTTTTVTTTEPPTNPLDSLLDKIDKEVKSKLDGNSTKTKTSSTSDSQYNDQQYQQYQQEQEQEQQEQQEQQEKQEKQEKQEQTSLISSSTDLDPYYDQYQMATNDADYQSFLAEHGGNAEYKLTARFNSKTGKFQRDPTLNPEKFSADSKAIRQMSYFFDYDQFAETRGSSASNKRLSSEASLGDSIKSPKKLNKKDIEMFKQKKREKKDMKKKSWLLSEND